MIIKKKRQYPKSQIIEKNFQINNVNDGKA